MMRAPSTLAGGVAEADPLSEDVCWGDWLLEQAARTSKTEIRTNRRILAPRNRSLSDGAAVCLFFLADHNRLRRSGRAAHEILDCTVARLWINNNLRDKTSLHHNVVAANNRSGAMC
jgi:hypothetical protein